MNVEIMEKKNLKKNDIITIINKDDEIVEETKRIKSRQLIYGFLIILLMNLLFFLFKYI